MKRIILILLLFTCGVSTAQSSWSIGGTSTTTTIIDTTTLPNTYQATWYGVTADGVTDDTAELQAVIDTCSAHGGGTIYLPTGTILISSTITIDTNNVVLKGKGMSPNYDALTVPLSTRIYWGGAAGGTMLEILPINDANHGYAYGCKIYDVEFYGGVTNLAANGLIIRSHRWGEFRNVSFRKFVSNALVLSTLTGTTLGEARDAQQNLFDNIFIRQYDTTGICINLGGNDGANASFNTFRNITCLYKNGTGISLGNCDNNLFENVQMYRGTDGTGVGVRLAGDNTSADNVCRYNSFISLSAGAGGVIAKGTTTYTYPSNNNRIIFYDKDNGAPDPTIETDASLTWSATF